MRPSTVLFLFNKSKIVVSKKKSNDLIRHLSVTAANKMRLVQFRMKTGGHPHLGAQINKDGDIVDISNVDHTIPNTLTKFLSGGMEVYKRAKRLMAHGQKVVHLKEVELLSPVLNPNKVICVALNYTSHCEERKLPIPIEPIFFSKFASALTGPYHNIQLPKISNSVDWEVELAIVMGHKAKEVRTDQAEDYIFGYTVAQDITARDWLTKRNGGQFLLGKTMDTFCPMGPVVVSKNKLDLNNMNIKCWVNGKLKQDGNTSEMVFKPNLLVSYLSQIMTLYPGDVILTGTPGGVGGYQFTPQFLQKGDIVESEIEGIGKIKNVCV